MKIDELLRIIDGKLIGNYKDIKIKSFNLDSRKLKKDDCFIALKGKKYDASNFINDNIKCKVIITEKEIPLEAFEGIENIDASNEGKCQNNFIYFFNSLLKT